MRERSRNKRKIEKYEKRDEKKIWNTRTGSKKNRGKSFFLPYFCLMLALGVSHHRLLCDISNGHL